MKSNSTLKFWAAFLFCLTSFWGIAQKTQSPFSIGVIDTVKSEILGERRVLNIYLPEGYSKSDTTIYPVIYLLDGWPDEDFLHISGLVQFLTMINSMPNSIVIGIANVDRKRDFTHPATVESDKKLLPTSGGSEKFMAFIEKELQPYLQQHYKVKGPKTIIGQSLGGLLATEILLKKPAMFDNYIIVSPSLWWNNESLLSTADSLINSAQINGTMNVCIAIGNEGKQMQDDGDKLLAILKAEKKVSMSIIYIPMPEENHLTILHRAVYRAFLALNQKK